MIACFLYSPVCLCISRSVLPPTCDYLEVPEGVKEETRRRMATFAKFKLRNTEMKRYKSYVKII